MKLWTEKTPRNLTTIKPVKSFRKRWIEFVDVGLHLCLPEEKVKDTWRLIYRYNPWRLGGILVGSLILTASMQLSASALILGDSEEEITKIFKPYLTGVVDFISVLFGSGRLLLLIIGIALIVVGLWDGLRNQGSNWHIWAGIGSALVLAIVLTGVWEDAVFG